ncbi:hypothetical protein HQ529_00625 [Candidatus Woesearchaeota archaeon]|nr:hypothetical protein [Candidatus Woesearchaeota archaeon]
MKNKVLITVFVIVLLVILIWAPWITKNYAENRVSEEFSSKWDGVMDGCGFNCDGCGIKESHRALFGYSVEIEYACGMKISSSEFKNKIDNIFVSFLSTVHGL